MSHKKFDGPSFVNPAHTSQALNQGNFYQTPKVNYNNTGSTNTSHINKVSESSDSKNKKGPRGGWEDDFGPDPQLKSGEKKNIFVKANSNKNNNIINQTNHESVSSNNGFLHNNKNHNSLSENSGTNYWDSENSKKIQNSTLSVEYETKLIDGILLPTGVTIKPSENQIKEFLKRLKTLNKQIVLNILLERLNNYESMTSTDQIKVIQVRIF